MSIDWLAFLAVFGAALVSACLIVLCFAAAIRLLATPPIGAKPGGAARDEEMDAVERGARRLLATIGAVVLFVISGAAVLVGVYLIVPALHS
jgi:hypothetical protein